MNDKKPQPPGAEDIRQSITDSLIGDLVLERKSERKWKLVKRGMFVGAFALGMGMYLYGAAKQFGWAIVPNSDMAAIINIEGEISADATASADKIVPLLKKAFEDDNVKSVVLSIDSPGGAPVEAERIYKAVGLFKKENPKPVVAVINNVGASAAYLIALHADKIVAANYSLVGSIGAVLAGWDFHRALDTLRVSQRVYASGEYKSMLNPFVPMTPQADAKAQQMVDKMGERFEGELVKSRGKKLQAGFQYATGEVWDGIDAKRIGLVDELGTVDTVVQATGFKGVSFGPRQPGTGWIHGMKSALEWLDTAKLALPGV